MSRLFFTTANRKGIERETHMHGYPRRRSARRGALAARGVRVVLRLLVLSHTQESGCAAVLLLRGSTILRLLLRRSAVLWLLLRRRAVLRLLRGRTCYVGD